MKTQVTFKDSFDDSEVTVSICPENKNYIITIAEEQVWLNPDDMREFINETQRFYIENEQKKE